MYPIKKKVINRLLVRNPENKYIWLNLWTMMRYENTEGCNNLLNIEE
jgi:hypothetical protein